MKILHLPKYRFGHTIYMYREVDSTQNQTMILARQGSEEGVIVITQTQNQGRGRENTHWVSEKGGLYFSIIYRPHITLTDAVALTKTIGVLVKRVIEKIVSRHIPIDIKLKGVNDLILNNRKIAGILVETITCAGGSDNPKPKFYIIGIGININQNHFPRHYENNATSLRIETDRYFSRFRILRAICEALETGLPQ